MTDDMLRHLCKLSAVYITGLSNKSDWIDYIQNADRIELHQEHNCISILADAFRELLSRSEFKPVFRVKTRLDEARP